MTKLERAIKEAEQLPPEMQDQLGDDLLHYVQKWIALHEAIAVGVDQLDRGEVVPVEVVFAKLRARFGA